MPHVIFNCCQFKMSAPKRGCLILPRLLPPRFSSSPPLLASQVGEIKTQGEEARKGVEGVQTEKGEEGTDSAVWIRVNNYIIVLQCNFTLLQLLIIFMSN